MPRDMTSQTLNALKGWPHMAAVDFSAKFSATILAARVPAGAVVSLNPSVEYVLGVGNTNRMPLFTFNASDDPDVVNDGGDPTTEKGVWVGMTPSGAALAFPAVIAAELVSTNYDTDNPADYVPNAKLTSPVEVSALAGKLVLGTLGTHTIVGVVSQGIVNNGYGTDAVAFWPVFLPVYP